MRGRRGCLRSSWFVSAIFFLMIRLSPRSPLFPTRRSSDLRQLQAAARHLVEHEVAVGPVRPGAAQVRQAGAARLLEDRKSTRLNSSHMSISYAVFCLKKKKRSAARQLVPPRIGSARQREIQ